MSHVIQWNPPNIIICRGELVLSEWHQWVHYGITWTRLWKHKWCVTFISRQSVWRHVKVTKCKISHIACGISRMNSKRNHVYLSDLIQGFGLATWYESIKMLFENCAECIQFCVWWMDGDLILIIDHHYFFQLSKPYSISCNLQPQKLYNTN